MLDFLNDSCLCGGCGCQQLADNPKLNWEYIQGILTGQNEPLQIPVSYPAIDFSKDTKKVFYQVAGVIAGAIVIGFIASNMLNEKKRLK